MSSCGNPTVEGDAVMPRRPKFDRGRDCIKCKLKPGNIVIRHAVYCRECFIPLVVVKFRRALEPHVNAHAGTSKRPRLKASGSLVLGFSGGLGSSVLLNLIHETYFDGSIHESGQPRGGKNHPRNMDVWTSCAVCYVEGSSAFPRECDRTEDVRGVLDSYPNFEFIPLRLEDGFDDLWWGRVTGTPSKSRLALELEKGGLPAEELHLVSPSTDHPPVDALRAFLVALPTPTAVSSAIRILTRLLLFYTAKSRGASHVLLGTTLTTMSISLISCIAQGGGHAILEEMQEEWPSSRVAPHDESKRKIRMVRPLRDVTMKECAAFAWWKGIRVPGRSKATRAIAGITGLTRDFIVGLEKDYPSTVSAIARTCSKLEPKSASIGECTLCHRPLQEGLANQKTRISIRSYLDPKLDSDLIHVPLSAAISSPVTSTPSASSLSMAACLCYSCLAMLTSRSNRGTKPTPSSEPLRDAPLPMWVETDMGPPPSETKLVSGNGEVWMAKRLNGSESRELIAEFLLDSSHQ